MPAPGPSPTAAFLTLLVVAVPIVVLATMWAAVTAVRLLRPEAPLPPVRGGRLVGVRDIAAAERRRAESVAATAVDREGDPIGDAPPHPFTADLWLRRN